eukprot:3842368-Prymnesium_polylepis.1
MKPPRSASAAGAISVAAVVSTNERVNGGGNACWPVAIPITDASGPDAVNETEPRFAGQRANPHTNALCSGAYLMASGG